MTNAADDALLVDTNVLVFAANPQAPLHSAALAILVRHRAAQRQMWITPAHVRKLAAQFTSQASRKEWAKTIDRFLHTCGENGKGE